MFLWRFPFLLKRRLKKMAALDNGLRLQTSKMKSDCIQEILSRADKILSKYPEIKEKLINKRRKEKVSRTYRDVLGRKQTQEHPLFAQNEIEKLKKNNRTYRFLVFLFIIAEGMLYSMTAVLFVPGNEVIMYVAGFIFAIASMMGLHICFKYYFTYKMAESIVEQENLDEEYLKGHRIKKYLGWLVGFLVLAFIISAAFLRTLYLEPDLDIPGINKAIFYFSFSATLVIAFILGVYEFEQAENAVKYREYKNWRKNNKERNNYIIKLRNMRSELNKVIKEKVEIYWSLVHVVQRIFGRSVDEIDKGLAEEFKNEKKAGNIKNINDDIYEKFKDVQYMDEELFKYGIYNAREITEIREELNESLEQIENFDERYHKYVEEKELLGESEETEEAEIK